MSDYWYIAFLIAFGAISTFLVVTLSGVWELPTLSQILPILIAIPISTAIRFGLNAMVTDPLSKKVGKARPEELQREDDVLLQAIAFSQTVLFFLVNLVITEAREKVLLGTLIAVFAVAFYVMRAIAKVRDDSRFRYYSMFIFSFILATTVISSFVTITTFFFPKGLVTSSINFLAIFLVYSSIAESSGDLVRNVFRKRYGI